MKKFLKISLLILGVLLGVILIIASILWVKSPNKADPITDSSGKEIPISISSVEKLTIGGINQHLIIRGADASKPVMLFIHGGPGSPEFAFMKHFNRAIENIFVMVYWEQRGAGKSYSSKIPLESMNITQFISDTRELSQYLIKRFNTEKIFIMGHSWGSLLGLLTIHQHPVLSHAYFGVGQVADQYKAEKLSYDWVLEQAHQRNDNKAIKVLSDLSFPDSNATIKDWMNYLKVERQYVNKYGGAFRSMEGMWPLIKIILFAKEYSFTDKVYFMVGNMYSIEKLWLQVINTNLFNSIDSVEIPVYFFQGIHDYQTPHAVALDFYDQLKAPHKEFHSFENSAHSPLMEEVERFNSILYNIQLILIPLE